MNKQEYLLDCLMEECAEVIQAASKVQRFGRRDNGRSGSKPSAMTRLNEELNDVTAIIAMLNKEMSMGSFHPLFRSRLSVEAKIAKVKANFERSREAGCLND